MSALRCVGKRQRKIPEQTSFLLFTRTRSLYLKCSFVIYL